MRNPSVGSIEKVEIRRKSPRGTAMLRGDKLFLIALVFVILTVQTLLLSPVLQSLIPSNPAAALRLPTITTPDYTEYRSTFSCLPTQTQSSCAIHAKYSFIVSTNDTKSYGILAADYNGNLEFRLNGTLVEVHGPVIAVQRLMFGLPTLVAFPKDVLKTGTNTVEMTVSSDLPMGALIHQVFIGEINAVQEIFRGMYVKKWSIPKQIEGMLIAAWIFLGYLAMRHRKREYYSLFVFSTFISCSIIATFFSENLSGILRILPMLFRLSAAAFIGAVLTANLRRASFISIKYLLLIPVALVAMFVQAKGSFEMLIIVQIFWLFSILICVIAMFYAVGVAVKNRDYPEFIPLIIAMIAVYVNVFNLLPTFGILNASMIGARGYVAVTLVIIVMIKLSRTFTQNLTIAETANETLSNEVTRVRHELDLIHRADNMLKQQVTVQSERERLMGDLHDGLAGNLISINALAEHGKPAALDEIRRLSKLALLDLRLVVDSLDTFDGELAVALGAFKERIMPQYSGTPTKISWDTDRAPSMESLRPEVNLAIFRILQEAIANSVRHGRATRVHIIVRASKRRKTTASIWVLDNGAAAGLFAPGFGMRNMQRRAEKIQGNVFFRLHRDGSAVLLKI